MTGEHIDYALFSVLPVAIERDVLIACAARPPNANAHLQEIPGRVVLENLCTRYTRQEFSPVIKGMASSREKSDLRQKTDGHWHLDIDKRHLQWDSYVKSAYHVRSVVIGIPRIILSHSGHAYEVIFVIHRASWIVTLPQS